jgi:hypothetical protein
MRFLVLISLCLSLPTTSLPAKNAEFSEHRTLPPLKLSAADLDTILRKTQTLVAAANGTASDEESARESVKLGVRGHEIEIPHFSLASSVAFPKEVFKFSYFYKRPDKPQICASDLSPKPCCSSPRNSTVVFPSAMQSLTNRPMQITANDTFSLAPGKPLC